MKIVLKIMILITSLVIPLKVYANNNFKITNISNDSYSVNFNASYLNIYENNKFFVGKKLKDYEFKGSIKYGDKVASGIFYWDNPDYIIKNGEQTVKCCYKLDFDYSHKFEIPTDEVIMFDITIIGTEYKIISDQDADYEIDPLYKHHSYNDNDNIESYFESPLITSSLTATSLTMAVGTTYDINVNDRPESATYLWTSSNTKVATVNSKTGLVTAKSKGKATITCKITTSDDVYTLTSSVVVGLNDDSPILSADELDLNIGDKFDIDVENQIKGSKYRYVSSNKSIATVNSANGIITAKKEGTVTIRCVVTTPDKKVIVLKCKVNVEY